MEIAHLNLNGWFHFHDFKSLHGNSMKLMESSYIPVYSITDTFHRTNLPN